MTNRRKIFNDPVYGFVTCPSDLIFDLIQHPYFQRLRRIKQLGLTDFVYPGALHTRFHHALGAMHLMSEALETLQQKGHLIMEIEKEAAQIAILLHDIGHGPFSHVLEYSLLKDINHEAISEMVMKELNQEFQGKLSLAIEMFNGKYHRKFFHQLISSQLDMDRLDYLNRDSFFTGVVEGHIGVERIIKMLNVIDNELVVEQKGILTVENFLNARRIMYWQVYLHKTAVSAEIMLQLIFERVRVLLQKNIEVAMPEYLAIFLKKHIDKTAFETDKNILKDFLKLDDTDIWHQIKQWQNHKDSVLSFICQSLINRHLYKIKLDVNLVSEENKKQVIGTLEHKNILIEEQKYFYQTGEISNNAYLEKHSNIKILMKNGEILDISEASDLPTIKAMQLIVKKYYICFANVVYLQNISYP